MSASLAGLLLDHIGIAVTSIDEGAKFYAAGLGLREISREVVAEQQVRVLKLDTGNTHVELLEPLEPGAGPIGKFLATRGPGIHHLCFRVSDVVAMSQKLVAEGYRALSEAPQPGANGCSVIFLHPKDTFGTLIELSQLPAAAAE